MAHRRPFPLRLEDAGLEPRALLSRAEPSPIDVSSPSVTPVPVNLFHQNGINGLVLHKSFVNQLDERLTNSGASAARVSQAFQVFETNYARLPVTVSTGFSGPSASSLLADLQNQVDFALTVLQGVSVRPQPSVANSIRVSPLAPEALIPFANEQISQLGATLAAMPPVVGPDGTLVRANPTPALNQAINAIFNALAESSIHPNLFRSPSAYYISPDVQFTIGSTGTPAQSSPGYVIRGPYGVILPGATLHPHLPL
jgi:hypothetical protein